MKFKADDFIRRYAVAGMVMASLFAVPICDARAHGNIEHENYQTMVSDPALKEECGACHVVYPPQMLPVESWRAIMAGLDKHFGSNAGLDAETANEITAILVKNAATGKHDTSGKPLLRITETPRFKSQHREVSARAWKNPKVKSPSNCGACHTRAEEGNFNERYARIPE
jgi:hypothetical protein